MLIHRQQQYHLSNIMNNESAKDEQENPLVITDSNKLNAVVPPELPLDWTQMATQPRPVRLPRDVMEYPEDETELCIVGTAGKKITCMGKDLLQSCPNLESLILRSHLIIDMEGLDLPDNKLELLELYDNQIQALDDLNCVGPNLRVLDMSYNVIRDMMPVSICPNLTELYLANNKIKSVAGLSSLVKLRKIDLGANRIRTIDEKEFTNLVNLEELWLGKNKIEEIGPNSLLNLKKLRRLDLQANRLTKLDYLQSVAPLLEEFYLSHNAITDEGLACGFPVSLEFPHLSTLDVSRNKITKTDAISHLTSIEDLWLSGNCIDSFENIMSLKNLVNLDCVYLEYNAISDDFEYRMKVKDIVGPNLNQIDAVPIGAQNMTPFASLNTSVKSVLKPAIYTLNSEDAKDLQSQVFECAKQQLEAKQESCSDQE